MLKKIAVWFIVFISSILIDEIGLENQGIAFLTIHVAINCKLVADAVIRYVNADTEYIDDTVAYRRLVRVLSVLQIVLCNVCIILFAANATAQIFDIDFLVSYQLICFGQCICSLNKKE